MEIKIVRPYDAKPRVQLEFPEGESGAKQQFKDECDINIIMTRYEKQGVLTHVNNKIPSFTVADGESFTEIMQKLSAAKEYFESLPSAIRNRFGNSVEQFVDAANNPEYAEQLKDLGFVDPAAVTQAETTNITTEETTQGGETGA